MTENFQQPRGQASPQQVSEWAEQANMSQLFARELSRNPMPRPVGSYEEYGGFTEERVPTQSAPAAAQPSMLQGGSAGTSFADDQSMPQQPGIPANPFGNQAPPSFANVPGAAPTVAPAAGAASHDAVSPTRRGRGIVQADQAVAGRVGMSNALRKGDLILDDVLRDMVVQDASDLHLTNRSRPMIRKSGELIPLDGYDDPLDADALRRSLYTLLTQKQREQFEEHLELDLAYQVPDGARFRVNLYQQRDSVGAAFRVIPTEIKPLEDLGVPPSVESRKD